MIWHDLVCTRCKETFPDFPLDSGLIEHPFIHFRCGGTVVIFYNPKRKSFSQWSERDAVVVYRRSEDGKILYPPTNDQPTPSGCERIELRSLCEVERFEKAHHVRNEMAWYDPGSGRGAEKG